MKHRHIDQLIYKVAAVPLYCKIYLQRDCASPLITTFSFLLCRSTGLTCPAPTVPLYPPSMQSPPARTYSGWCSPLSSPPCPTLTRAPTHMAITWPMAQGCWDTTRWPGPGLSAPSETPGAGAKGTNRWGPWEDGVGLTGLQDHL